MNTIDSPNFNIEKFSRRLCENYFPRAIQELEQDLNTIVSKQHYREMNQVKCEGRINIENFMFDSEEDSLQTYRRIKNANF